MKANDNNIFFWEKMNAFLIVVNATQTFLLRKVKMKPLRYLEHKSNLEVNFHKRLKIKKNIKCFYLNVDM